MLDQAGIRMAQGDDFACERITGVNDNMYQPHYHNYYEIYFLEEGERYQRIKNELYLLKAGDIMLFSPYVMHYSYGDKDMHFRRIILYFRPDAIETKELVQILDDGNGMYRPSKHERQLLQRLLSEFIREQEEESPFSKECQQSLLNLFLYHLARQTRIQEPVKAEQKKRISQVVRYIHQHYREDISLESLAKHFSISTYYLCREFKSYTNSTVIQYVNVTRVMHAQRMLMETDRNITEICLWVGFSNLTHFNRVFKQVTGMTPSGFRKSHQNIEISIGGRGI